MVEHLHPPALGFVQSLSMQELVRGLLEGSGETEEIAKFGNEVRRRVLEDLRAVTQGVTGCRHPESFVEVSERSGPTYTST
ncbi:hypothetical protein SAMN05444161_4701 [Rhizobiales bacterium GAS191]|nr:hypothetical protein SAMN05444161_4701 [Rhizobiales bacterium GAS191]